MELRNTLSTLIRCGWQIGARQLQQKSKKVDSSRTTKLSTAAAQSKAKGARSKQKKKQKKKEVKDVPSINKLSIPLYDIGANLIDPMFQGIYRDKRNHEADLDMVLQRAWDAGIGALICTAGSLSESEEALSLAQRHPGRVYCTVGVHPTRCCEFETTPSRGGSYMDQLLRLATEGAKKGHVVAVGEFGLDYDRLQFCPKDTQLRFFEAQFAVAEATGLPLFLHNRNTNGDFLAVLKRNRKRFTQGVVHSFTGSVDEAQELLALDLFIGINGCSLKTDANLAVAKSIPMDRLLIETDAPWCDIRRTHAGFKHVKSHWPSTKPKRHERGKCVKNRTEPCHLRQVLEVMAALHGVTDEQLAATIRNNTQRIFPTLL